MTVLEFPGRRKSGPGAGTGNSIPERITRRTSAPRRKSDAHLLKQSGLLDYYRAVLDATDRAVIGLSTTGTVTIWNRMAECAFGYTSQESLGRFVGFLAGPSAAALRAIAMDVLLSRGDRRQWESVKIRGDGTPVRVTIDSRPLYGPSDRCIGMIWFVRIEG